MELPFCVHGFDFYKLSFAFFELDIQVSQYYLSIEFVRHSLICLYTTIESSQELKGGRKTLANLNNFRMFRGLCGQLKKRRKWKWKMPFGQIKMFVKIEKFVYSGVRDCWKRNFNTIMCHKCIWNDLPVSSVFPYKSSKPQSFFQLQIRNTHNIGG